MGKSSKKKSSRRRSPSSSSSSDDGLTQLELEKMKLLEEKIRAKKNLKECETLEEKRNRRLQKKINKEKRRQERLGWGSSVSGYTNDDNPFGDERLVETFVWKKKMDKEGNSHLTEVEQKKLIQNRQAINSKDLEKVKEARMAREYERQIREADRAREAALGDNDIDAQRFKQWSEQEEEFHLQQARLRSKIRIKDGRANPIDLLARYLEVLQGKEEVPETELHEPYIYTNGLETEQLEDLIVDIEVYRKVDKSEVAQTFWDNVTTVANDLVKSQKASRSHRSEINPSVKADILKIFKGKSVAKLDELKEKVTLKIEQGQKTGADINYWEALIKELAGYRAKVSLQEQHKQFMKRVDAAQIEHEAEKAKKKAEKMEPVVFKEPKFTAPKYSRKEEKPKEDIKEAGIIIEQRSLEEIEAEKKRIQMEKHCQEMYEDKCYTPPLIDFVPDTEEIIKASIEILSLEEKRELIRKNPAKIKAAAKTTNTSALEDKFLQTAKQDMDQDEAEFSVEAQLENTVYKWADKYKPRKPKFFNRVHTGFEWNKYNQMHYDFDNPPPKIVQGYKFNIFYPDLIDKSVSPDYDLLKLEEDPEFCVLRVKSGPPYEDIAFKIVNREWDFGNKKGFRCQFMNGMFQLWFYYKRYRYRR
ncbi:Oidioi.mRNA.OKI2018_I69.XSR.g16155.t1.cds [Oikopleura dioica]|uniref:Splicing factor Cactin n=1 Tax=Oikopleura dioica TaxID=34765 RepID=A0ABN7SJ41_OIKDI|nr:Oidioi.mRNA.OKI2018_I69.XSR.g16155.t1.cds [Oikopleura dioica]